MMDEVGRGSVRGWPEELELELDDSDTSAWEWVGENSNGRAGMDSHGPARPPCLHRARLPFAMHVGHRLPSLLREPFSTDRQ